MYVSWTNHNVQLTASMVKEVTCEKCRNEYAYALSRTESGMGTSVYGVDQQGAQNRAADSAAAKLQNSLDNAFEIVPCPTCGAYQSQMVLFLKNSHLKWMVLLAGILVAASIILIVVAIDRRDVLIAATSGMAFLIGVGMVVYRQQSAHQYDPNGGDPSARIQLAKTLAFLKTEPSPPTGASEGKESQAESGRRRRARR